MIDQERLLRRFLQYVRVDTTAREAATTYPSSPGQLQLGRMLKSELEALGLTDVCQSRHGIVLATIPPTVDKRTPVVALNSHFDTSPETTGAGVRPQVVRNYHGGDIPLPGNPTAVIRTADNPQLSSLVGCTIITTDGTTLLGADDKAGVAIIMTAAAHLMANPNIKRGPIRVVYTCDEEVGRGVDKVTPEMINAKVAYTLDGESAGSIENETFSADLATVTITGYNIHPGLATGKMINSIRLAGQFISRMPWHFKAPETTSKRIGFLHPYVIEGGVPEVKIKILLRSFVTAELAEQADLLRHIAATLMAEWPRAKVDVNVTKQYRNMVEVLAKEPRAVALPTKAVEKLGIKPKFESIRGGTDGSRLSEMGLPTPNIFTGMHNFHSCLEYACLEEMELAVKTLVELAQLWGKEK